MAIQEIRNQIQNSFQLLAKIEQNNKFLNSCISEGLIPKGLTINFQLAKYVNDEDLVNNIKDIIEEANSRVIYLIFEKNVR